MELVEPSRIFSGRDLALVVVPALSAIGTFAAVCIALASTLRQGKSSLRLESNTRSDDSPGMRQVYFRATNRSPFDVTVDGFGLSVRKRLFFHKSERRILTPGSSSEYSIHPYEAWRDGVGKDWEDGRIYFEVTTNGYPKVHRLRLGRLANRILHSVEKPLNEHFAKFQPPSGKSQSTSVSDGPDNS